MKKVVLYIVIFAMSCVICKSQNNTILTCNPNSINKKSIIKDTLSIQKDSLNKNTDTKEDTKDSTIYSEQNKETNDSVKTVKSLVDSLNIYLTDADSLYDNCEFQKAQDEYLKAKEICKDSIKINQIESKLLNTSNCLQMMNFCYKPKVIAKQKFSLKEFFLFYPLGEGAWRKTPNQLDTSLKDTPVKALYIPKNTNTLYFSKIGDNGKRNIYTTSKKDSVWTVPHIVSEKLTTTGNEVFPMISADKKSLYFSSNGLYGAGKYDIYVSKWDDISKEWSQPINLGFPFSSPYDDFLYYDTPDGKYTIFASNRDCGKDSVYVYVLEKEITKVAHQITDPKELKNLLQLNIDNDLNIVENTSMTQNSDNDTKELESYSHKMSIIRELQDQITRLSKKIDNQRDKLPQQKGELRDSLIKILQNDEAQLPIIKDSLKKVQKQVSDLEIEFLNNGLIIDPDMIKQETDKEVIGAEFNYTFVKNRMGDSLHLKFEKPKEDAIDYSFKILPKSTIYQDVKLPDGTIYQIQLFALSNKVKINNLKGISPVFERHHNSKYIYCVGAFPKYEDAIKYLVKIKNMGFKTAKIIGFYNNIPTDINVLKHL